MLFRIMKGIVGVIILQYLTKQLAIYFINYFTIVHVPFTCWIIQEAFI